MDEASRKNGREEGTNKGERRTSVGTGLDEDLSGHFQLFCIVSASSVAGLFSTLSPMFGI